MKRIIAITCVICSLLGLTACAQNQSKKQMDEMNSKKILVAYFSRADEN